MRTKLFTIALAFIGLNSLAQITVEDINIVDVGDVIYEALDSVSGSAIQIGSAGPNETWDFSALQQNDVNIIEYVNPNSTPFGFMHPESNICTEDDGQNLYMNKSSIRVEMVGIDDNQLLNPVTILPLPLTYGMQYSTGAILAFEQIEENSFYHDSLAPFISQFQAHTLDSIKLEVTLGSSYNVDGYGDVIIPMGTFPALRLYVSSTNTQTFSVYCTDTTMPGTGSNWYPAPQQLLPSETNSEYFYQWWSNDPAVKFTLVNIDVDEFGNNYGHVEFLTNPLTSIEERNDLEASVYPIPTSYKLIIESKSSNLTDLTLFDVMGKLVFSDKFSGTTQIDLTQISKGIYYLHLKTTEGELTKKIIVE